MTTLSTYDTELSESAETIYALWATPHSWPDWDPDVASVDFLGDAHVGAQGRLHPTSGPTARFTITRLEDGRRVTTATRLPGATLTFDHIVTPAAAGCHAEVRIMLDGPLAPLWRLALGRSFASAANRNIAGLSQRLVSQ